MKDRINLLYKARTFKKRELMFAKFRKLTLLFGSIVLLVVATVFYLQFVSQSEYSSLLRQKKELVKKLLPLKDAERKLFFVQDRAAQFESKVKEKTQFPDYFNFISQTLPISSDSANILDFSIDKKDSFSATVSFNSIAQALTFLDSIQDRAFTDAFGTIEVKGISLTTTEINASNPLLITISGNVKKAL